MVLDLMYVTGAIILSFYLIIVSNYVSLSLKISDFFRQSFKNYLFAALKKPLYPEVFSPFLLNLYRLKKIYRLS